MEYVVRNIKYGEVNMFLIQSHSRESKQIILEECAAAVNHGLSNLKTSIVKSSESANGKKELESLVLKFGVSKLKSLVSMVVVEPYMCVLFSHS